MLVSMSASGRALPRDLVAAARAEGRTDWLHGIEAVVARTADEWALTVGPPFQPGGQTAWMAPVRTAVGDEQVLKVAWRHSEAEHKADGLRIWGGGGAVQLFDVAELDDTIVMLLERCRPGTPLSAEPESVQDDVIAGLLRRMWLDPPVNARFRPLAQMCEEWAAQFDAKLAAGQVVLDPGIAAVGIGLFRSLPAEAGQHVLLCTDLHAGNVLAAEREPWLMIDPKPYVGDPAYDVVQHMLNCAERLAADPVSFVRRMAGLLGIDHRRLLLWLFARCIQESPG